ncbi:MAG: putative DNA binding domain-containing protein [Thermodesulfobacteriota bacterium]|nr:putative DNA binding domain-containing protein [Thermodesulfobacteriota bacterium]
MELTELLKLIQRGEDSTLEFKQQVPHKDALTEELAALANYRGGQLLVGVSDAGELIGISREEAQALHKMLDQLVQNNLRPPILHHAVNLSVGEGRLIVCIEIPLSENKPHFTHKGVIPIRTGTSRKNVGSREEFRRLFQDSALVHADETVIPSASSDDIDLTMLTTLLTRKYGSETDALDVLAEKPLPDLLDNLGLGRNGKPNITGLLLAGKEPQLRVPAFLIRAISWVGNDPEGAAYRDSENIDGTLPEMYKNAMAFLNRNLIKPQAGQSFNTAGQWPIPKDVFEELLVNALLHRDYFLNDTIKLFIFDDRIEIISPGVLPNNLTVEKIRLGNSNMRNPVLTSFGTFVLPYRGAGTGVRRALKAWPDIDFDNNHDFNAFRCVIRRTTPL